MAEIPVGDEIASALGRFFFAGAGPSHAKLRAVFVGAGYGADDPYSPVTQQPNKERRVLAVLWAAKRRPERAREVVEALLVEMRVHGCFRPENSEFDKERVRTAQRAFARQGWTLSDEGVLGPAGDIDLSTGGRKALDEQLDRLRRGAGDAGQLLGSAKDLLEAVAKFVLEEFGVDVPRSADYAYLWYLARERVGALPEQVDESLPGAANIKSILQSSWRIAEQVNKLRGVQGAGHGRTLPTGVDPDMALLVVREACSVAEFILARLDRASGR